MRSSWLANEGQKIYVPEDNYKQTVEIYQKQADDLSKQIQDLTAQRDALLAGNHAILVDKQNQCDEVISQQHKIKQTLLDGTLELNERMKEAQDLKYQADNAFLELNNRMTDFQKNSQAVTDYQNQKQASLDALDVCLKALQVSLNAEDKNMEQARQDLAQAQADNDATLISLNNRSNELDYREAQLNQRDVDYNLKAAKYRANYAALCQAQNDFADTQKAVYAQKAQNDTNLATINQKNEEQKSLIIEAARVHTDTTTKLALLNDATLKNQQSITDLTNLRNQFLKQGATNASTA